MRKTNEIKVYRDLLTGNLVCGRSVDVPHEYEEVVCVPKAELEQDRRDLAIIIGIADRAEARVEALEGAFKLILAPHGLDVSQRIRDIAESVNAPGIKLHITDKESK